MSTEPLKRFFSARFASAVSSSEINLGGVAVGVPVGGILVAGGGRDVFVSRASVVVGSVEVVVGVGRDCGAQTATTSAVAHRLRQRVLYCMMTYLSIECERRFIAA